MSSPYCDGTEDLFEQCPKCGHAWDAHDDEAPKWIEWDCPHCHYSEGETWGVDRCVLKEGDPALQHDNPLRPRGD